MDYNPYSVPIEGAITAIIVVLYVVGMIIRDIRQGKDKRKNDD